MKTPGKVGITGGIGAGKSIVAKIFNILGIPVYDADSRAKALMTSDPKLRQEVVAIFGPDSYQEGLLNRQHIGKIAFYHPEKLNRLNELVHPAVGNEYEKWHSQQKTPYTLKEAALLFEAGSYRQLDKIITVSCPQDIRIQRVLKRDPHRKTEDVMKIIEKQWAEASKIAKSNYVIVNDDSRSVIQQVLELDSELKYLFG